MLNASPSAVAVFLMFARSDTRSSIIVIVSAGRPARSLTIALTRRLAISSLTKSGYTSSASELALRLGINSKITGIRPSRFDTTWLNCW